MEGWYRFKTAKLCEIMNKGGDKEKERAIKVKRRGEGEKEGGIGR